MSRSLSNTFLGAAFAPETDEWPLVLLDIEYELAGEQHIRVVNNWGDVTSNGDTYSAYPFEITIPPEYEDQPPQVTLRIDNVDRSLMTAIRSVTTPPTVSLSVILASDPDTIEIGPLEMTLRDVQYSASTISGVLSHEIVLEETFPGHRMSPANFPGVFGGLPPGTEWETDAREGPGLVLIGARGERKTTTHGRRGHE